MHDWRALPRMQCAWLDLWIRVSLLWCLFPLVCVPQTGSGVSSFLFLTLSDLSTCQSRHERMASPSRWINEPWPSLHYVSLRQQPRGILGHDGKTWVVSESQSCLSVTQRAALFRQKPFRFASILMIALCSGHRFTRVHRKTQEFSQYINMHIDRHWSKLQ